MWFDFQVNLYHAFPLYTLVHQTLPRIQLKYKQQHLQHRAKFHKSYHTEELLWMQDKCKFVILAVLCDEQDK